MAFFLLDGKGRGITVFARPFRRSSVIGGPAVPAGDLVIGHIPSCRHPQAAGHRSSVIGHSRLGAKAVSALK
jgi:hypothetical protein